MKVTCDAFVGKLDNKTCRNSIKMFCEKEFVLTYCEKEAQTHKLANEVGGKSVIRRKSSMQVLDRLQSMNQKNISVF